MTKQQAIVLWNKFLKTNRCANSLKAVLGKQILHKIIDINTLSSHKRYRLGDNYVSYQDFCDFQRHFASEAADILEIWANALRGYSLEDKQ